MKKLALAWVSLVAVVLLVLGSQANVVGYQTVQTSQQELLNERVNQKDLLFDLIIDIANNPEVQKTIIEAQVKQGISLPLLPRQVITKAQLNMLYVLGIFLSKTIDRNKFASFVEEHRTWDPLLQERLSTIIEKDSRISQGLAQLSGSNCGCDYNKVTWGFPIICNTALGLHMVTLFLFDFFEYPSPPGYMVAFLIIELYTYFMFFLTLFIGIIFNCDWA